MKRNIVLILLIFILLFLVIKQFDLFGLANHLDFMELVKSAWAAIEAKFGTTKAILVIIGFVGFLIAGIFLWLGYIIFWPRNDKGKPMTIVQGVLTIFYIVLPDLLPGPVDDIISAILLYIQVHLNSRRVS